MGGYKTFTAETLTANDVNNLLMRQTVPRLATVAQRASIPSPEAGQAVYIAETNSFYVFNGTSWDEHFTAWKSYSPTVTASGGTFASVTAIGRWMRQGRTVHVRLKITISNKGDANGALLATLPTISTVEPYAMGNGRENALTGHQLVAVVQGGVMVVYKYDATTAIQTGYTLVLGATYEAD